MAKMDASTIAHYAALLKDVLAQAAQGFAEYYVNAGPALHVAVIGVLLFGVFTFAFVRWATA